MILKEKDSQVERIRGLEAKLRSASPSEKKRLEKELAILNAGIRGEEEAAYLIDFDLKNNPNWIVIHDLRLEWNDRVAQIDHLIINRLLEVFVVETKNIQTKVRIQNGCWERINFNHWEGMASPVEQNRRHIAVLKELIESQGLAPSRLGIQMACDYYNVVAISPKCSVVGHFPKDVLVFKMDDLIKRIRDADPSMTSVFKVVGQDTLHEFCQTLVRYHVPSPFLAPQKTEASKNNHEEVCEGCGGPVTSAESFFCRLSKNKARFAGKVLCRRCQSFAPTDDVSKPDSKVCENCGTKVEPRVIAFCLANEVRFKSKILCRPCQSSA